ncbi:MAG: hypothetical protein QOJ65_1344 [Fimbriimonadaceae bacterium]|jgi:uncharacterized membrane protein YoaT (DUF817 family)|nr:hypothetical protein [Fimbriimonadaceae bacterium]
MPSLPIPKWLRVFGEFVWLEAVCCIFPFCVIGLLALSHAIRIPELPRYDILFVGCVLIQALMVRWKLETVDEAKTIALFHVIGLGLELFKVNAGSWAYREGAYLKFGGVPLFSGFMYASVGSYVVQAWKRLDLQMSSWPRDWAVVLVCILTYGNFFSNRYIVDLRWPIIALICVVFWRVRVSFGVLDQRFRMPLLVSFVLIGVFVWIAENIGTRLHAWQYPYQASGWTHVDFGKLSSWSLLVIISVVLVAELKRVKEAASGVTVLRPYGVAE